MLPFFIERPDDIDAICKDLRQLNGLVQALDAQSLLRPYDSSARQKLHAYAPLDTLFSLATRAFVMPARDAFAPLIRSLVVECGAQLQRVEWTQLVAELQRCRGSLCTPGVAHQPVIWQTQPGDAANPVVQRKSTACCHAELLLLLLRAGLGLSIGGSQMTELLQGRGGALDVTTLWPPLLAAMHALLDGLQPHFQFWGNAVNMVQDALMVCTLARSCRRACMRMQQWTPPDAADVA